MRIILSLLLLLLTDSVVSASPSAKPGFDELLVETGLHYEAPVNYEELPLGIAPFGYEKRLAHKTQQIEIRYSIRPISRILVDYQDPHNAAPHPNDLFDMLFRSVLRSSPRGRIRSARHIRQKKPARFSMQVGLQYQSWISSLRSATSTGRGFCWRFIGMIVQMPICFFLVTTCHNINPFLTN